MSLDDRNYSRGSYGSGGSGAGDMLRGLSNILNLSFPIGRVLGIRLRVHILFVVFAATEIWPSQRLIELGVGASEQMLTNLRWLSLLFGSVLLHEFGHCFGCRWVGGRADDVLLWPLGGLAYCDPPRRPWPEFVTVACGPLVNVVLAGASYIILLATTDADRLPVTLNPFNMRPDTYWVVADSVGRRFLADLFVVNYALLLFNICMIFYPFDGGRLVQIALWKWLGYARSMLVATTFGMIGAVAVVGVGFWQGRHGFMLVLIGIFGFITCMQQRQQLRFAGSAEPEFDPRYAAAYEKQTGERGSWFSGAGDSGQERTSKPGAVARWRESRALKRANAERQSREKDEAEMNRILDKVHASGLQSLTKRERDTLQRATDRQRGG